MVDKTFKQLGSDLIRALGARFFSSPQIIQHAEKVERIDVNALGSYDYVNGSWDGEKYLGGFGLTKNYEIVDYWLLRKRSKQIFTENLYARGLIRRLITNIINKGLCLEATPDADILGLDKTVLNEWAENIERRFTIWGKFPNFCDYKKLKTYGAIQRQKEIMAMVSGDVLVVLRQGVSKLPIIELIDGEHVQTPFDDFILRAVQRRGNTIEHGVEIDAAGKHIAFYVTLKNGQFKRVPVNGPKTGRKQAWLYYGSEMMVDDVRGQSLLAIMIQSLKEIDRYRDSELRSAVINSMIAMWVEKTDDKPGTLPISAGAVRRDTVTTQDDSQGRKDVQFSSHVPGMILQELQTGEKPSSYDTKRPNVNFNIFETAILSAIAWVNEIPPETLFLQFQNNYSASRGATNEFKMFIEKKRSTCGEEFDDIVYQDFVISETLLNAIDSPGLLESWNDPNQWDKFGAWLLASWSGAIKPNVDLLKEVNAYIELVNQGWLTRDRASRELTGMKYSKVAQQLVSENEQLVQAVQPLIDAGLVKDQNDSGANSSSIDDVREN